MTEVTLYLYAVMRDGDWANDWITHLTPTAAVIVGVFGWTIAFITGG